MKRFGRLFWVGLAVVGCNALAWTSLEGCSGDDNKGDAGDAAPDQTADAKNDVAPDVTPDVTQDVSDAGFDAAPILDFQQKYAAALCTRLETCCYGAQDASAPDAALGTCEGLTKSAAVGGIEFAIGELARQQVINNGHLKLDSTAAASCLAGLATMSCGTVTGTEYATLAKNCLGALSGTIPTGQSGCYGSVECDNGYCQRPDGGFGDAGGTCVPLSAVGQPCDPFGGGNDQCMYRGWLGTQQARCDLVETTATSCATGGTPTYKCTAKTADNSTCLYEWECASDTCGDNCTCVPATQTWTYPFAGVCPEYFGQDSGLN